MRRLFNIEFVKGFKKTFTEQIIHQSFQAKDALSGKELVTLTPSKQLNFLIMKALFQEWQDEMKRLESPYFDYKHPDVKKALVQFMNVLSQHIEVSAATLKDLISKALDEGFVLVTDPAAFVRQEFAGRDQQTFQAKHAKPILKYLKLLTEEFDDFFNAQATGSYAEVFEIADDYFADVDLSESQERLFTNLSEVAPITLEELLDEEEFADITQFDEDLEEEELEPEVVEAPAAEEPKEEATLEVEDEPIAAEEEVNEPEEEAPVDEEVPEEEPEPDPEPVDEPEEDSSDPEDVLDEIEPDPEPEPTPEPELTPEPTPESDPEPEVTETATLNDQFSEAKEESLAEKLEKEEQPGTILSSVSVNQKYMFVQELFDGDANTFQKALAEIEYSGSFDDAVEHLVTNYARQFDWDMNSDEVKELLKVIFRRFR
ncbi:MAG: hypothetical protein R8G66_32635 [Cytophagales bacterium]|nr:hypothetical protein [Cytophagales bacterium]